MALLSELSDHLERLRISEKTILSTNILTAECNAPPLLSDGEFIREKKLQTDKIKGLELRGGIKTGDISDSADDDGGPDQGTANLEISWDLLKHGLLHNSRKAEALEVEALKADLEYDLKNLLRSYRCRRYQIKNEFSKMLIQLLQLKVDFLRPVYDVERRAYFKQWSFWDDYLVSEEDLLLTRHTLDGMLADPYFDKSTPYSDLPALLDINLAALLRTIREDDSYSALFTMEKDWLTAQQEAILHDYLRLYLRQEFGLDGAGEDQRDLVAGLRFRVPLYSRNSDLLDLQLRQIDRKKRNLLHDRLNQTRIRYTELQEQLRRTVRQYYRCERSKERMKRTLFMVKRGEENLLTAAITRMRTSIEAHIELVRAMEELYRRINEMFLTARVPFQPELIKPVALDPNKHRARYGRRALYIWSDAFNRTGNSELQNFIGAKSISTLLLSDGRKIDQDKQDRLLSELRDSDITVELITGDNNWIFRDNHDRAVQKSVLVAEKTGRLHLDVEPQALPDYQTNRKEYIELYTEMATKVKNGLLDRKLSLAVPFHWPGKTYEQLGQIADSLYVMAYGTTEPNVLLRRIRPLLEAVPQQKIVVVLRINDFTDEWAMERMIDSIANKTSILKFCIHDLGRFMRMWGDPEEDKAAIQTRSLVSPNKIKKRK